ncbi:hypothetical protein GQ53DRAFT_832179 [Thozetella sp. PMI_491]|nr:hypothetical protein GQ53DRAFT_832179 [Thozetella sp. PMI_491]
MLFAVFFIFWRIAEIITLIPTMGMLAYFVNACVQNNVLTPNYVLILFIVSVLALAWAIFTLFSYHRSSTNAQFVSIIDLGFVGAFIAGVYYLRFIANADCVHIDRGGSLDIIFGPLGYASVNGFDVSVDKTCGMLKACFAFGIMNCIFFFITAVLAWFHADRAPESKTYYRETRYRSGSRGHHHHRRHSHSGSRRSSRSHHRVYV